LGTRSLHSFPTRRSSDLLVAEAGDAWDVHHLAALFGYGAEAVHPWLALQSLRSIKNEPDEEPSAEKFRGAAEKGLLKILSKMGIDRKSTRLNSSHVKNSY